jgi:hypothetical protein
VEWLKTVYLRKLEGRAGAKELEEGVIALLNDGLLPGGTRGDRIDSEGLWTERAGVTLPLRELGDGYRSVAAQVLDIVKQIHACHGDFVPLRRVRLPEGRARWRRFRSCAKCTQLRCIRTEESGWRLPCSASRTRPARRSGSTPGKGSR